MKKRIFINGVYVLLAAVSVAAVVSCQKKYEMIPPPVVNGNNEFDDEEDVKSVYFVSQFGGGEYDGTSWENSLDEAGLRDLLTNSTDLGNSTIYVSEGEYLMSDQPGAGISVKKDIMAVVGGFSMFSTGTDVSDRDPEKYRTVFSGDVNHNRIADEGDCYLMGIYSGRIMFDGIVFSGGYIDARTAEAGLVNGNQTPSSGISLFGTDPSSLVLDMVNCTVSGCDASSVSSSAYAGGAALRIMNGTARLKNVVMEKNMNNNRGGAVRLCNFNSVCYMDGCAVVDNIQSGTWGVGIQASQGHLCMNNSTFMDNLNGSGAVINGNASFLIVNSTIILDSSTGTNAGAFRTESETGLFSYLINNVIVCENGTSPSIYVNRDNPQIKSYGYNVHTGETVTAGSTMLNQTDMQTAVNGVRNGCLWEWDASSLSGYATLEQVNECVSSFSPGYPCPVPELGKDFLSWTGDASLGMDARGEARNPEKLQPGAYDANLK